MPAGTTVLVRDLFLTRLPGARLDEKPVLRRLTMRGTGFPPCFSPAGYPLRDENQGKTCILFARFRPLVGLCYGRLRKTTGKEMLPVRSAEQGLSLTGLTGKPSLSRSSRSHITVIINGRYVRCPVVTAATEEAYRSLLPQGRRPVTVLALTVDPELLDVNVHPAKLEVRLLEEEKIAGLVTRTLMEAIRVKEIIPATKVTRPVLESSEHKESRFQLTIHQQQDQQVPPPGPETVICEQVTAKYETAGPGLSLGAADQGTTKPCPKEAEPAEETTGALLRKNELPVLNALAHLTPVYILAAGREGLYIVDQHAAHERILYESYLDQKGPKQSQCLLIPLMLELDYRDAAVLTERVLWFADAGFILEHFGGYSFCSGVSPPVFPPGKKIYSWTSLTISGKRGRGWLRLNLNISFMPRWPAEMPSKQEKTVQSFYGCAPEKSGPN